MKRKLRGFKRSAIELDFNLYRVGVPIANVPGDELSVIDIQPEGVERTVMLIHGYAGCAETWEHQINYFSKKYRVVAPDLRGHGQSDAPLSRYTMDELIADLYIVSQHLKLPDQFVLVGHSFGGSICVDYAYHHPDQIERLVLIATAGEYPLPKAVTLLYRLPTAFFRPWWKYRPRWNAEIHTMKRMMINNVRQWQGWSMMRDLEVPTLVITGERDNYFPRYVYDDVGKMVPGAEVVDVGVSKHKVQLERHKAVNRSIERFINGDSKASSWRSQETAEDLKKTRPWLDAYSDGTPFTVPIPRSPLHEFLYSAADWLPNKKATYFYGASMTYARLVRRVNQLAHALRGLGVGPGDRVLIVLPNMPEFVVAYYGTLVIGGVVVLSNPDAGMDQLIEQACQTEAKVLITLQNFGRLAQELTARSKVKEIVTIEFDSQVPDAVIDHLAMSFRAAEPALIQTGVDNSCVDESNQNKPADSVEVVGVTLTDLVSSAPITRPNVDVSPDSLAAILYTSGTTSEPKGVSLSHCNLVANAIQTRHWVPDLEYGKETFLSVVPLLHSYGMTAAMNLPIVAGASMVLLPMFEPKQVLEQIKRYRPTIFMAVPAMYGALIRVPDARSYGLSSIKACLSGSAPLPVEIQEAFEKLTHGRLVEGYGLTEASPVTHANPLYGRRKAGSIGVPLPNTDARIVSLSGGEDLPPGEIGRLYVKGPQVMQGYYREPSEFRALLAGGWLDTGDVALMDGDGYFHIIGRTRDVIRAGEHTVYPRDVEELLYENNKVGEAVVVGVPAESDDQKVKAFVVPRDGANLTSEELLDLCRRRLEAYAVPAEIEFRQELPKTFSGKVIRRLLA
jgi:long-chain acyl-CoA synthetase